DLLNGINRNTGDFENDTAAGQLGQGSGRTAVTNVDKLSKGILVRDCQLHARPPVRTCETVLRTSSALKGLVRKPLAPAACVSWRVELWMSAVARTTLADGSSSLNLVRTSRPFIPSITISSKTRSGF